MLPTQNSPRAANGRYPAPPARTRLAAGIGAGVAGVSRLIGRGGSVIGGRAILAVDPQALSRLSVGRTIALVSGTNGKTTTTSLLAHLLDAAGLAPGFLIGGVPENFGVSARLGAREPLSSRERGRGEGSESASNHPWCGAPVRPSLAARSKRHAMPPASRDRRFSPTMLRGA